MTDLLHDLYDQDYRWGSMADRYRGNDELRFKRMRNFLDSTWSLFFSSVVEDPNYTNDDALDLLHESIYPAARAAGFTDRSFVLPDITIDPPTVSGANMTAAYNRYGQPHHPHVTARSNPNGHGLPGHHRHGHHHHVRGRRDFRFGADDVDVVDPNAPIPVALPVDPPSDFREACDLNVSWDRGGKNCTLTMSCVLRDPVTGMQRNYSRSVVLDPIIAVVAARYNAAVSQSSDQVSGWGSFFSGIVKEASGIAHSSLAKGLWNQVAPIIASSIPGGAIAIATATKMAGMLEKAKKGIPEAIAQVQTITHLANQGDPNAQRAAKVMKVLANKIAQKSGNIGFAVPHPNDPSTPDLAPDDGTVDTVRAGIDDPSDTETGRGRGGGRRSRRYHRVEPMDVPEEIEEDITTAVSGWFFNIPYRSTLATLAGATNGQWPGSIGFREMFNQGSATWIQQTRTRLGL